MKVKTSQSISLIIKYGIVQQQFNAIRAKIDERAVNDMKIITAILSITSPVQPDYQTFTEVTMDDLKLPELKSELLDRATSLSKEGHGIHYQDFERVFRESAKEDITVDGWRKITSFTSDQLGFWESEWLFSSAYSPNTKAKSEMHGWKIICEACLGELKNKISEAADLIEEQHNLAVLKYSIKRAVDYNESKPSRKFKAKVRSSILIKLDEIGLRRVASRLYARALYPKGTVGRASN